MTVTWSGRKEQISSLLPFQLPKELKSELKEETGEIGLDWNLCSLNNVA